MMTLNTIRKVFPSYKTNSDATIGWKKYVVKEVSLSVYIAIMIVQIWYAPFSPFYKFHTYNNRYFICHEKTT